MQSRGRTTYGISMHQSTRVDLAKIGSPDMEVLKLVFGFVGNRWEVLADTTWPRKEADPMASRELRAPRLRD